MLTIAFSSCGEKKIKYVASPKGLNLRSKADLTSQKIAALPFMTKVTIINESGKNEFVAGRHGKWVNIEANNQKGWVFDGFLCEFDIKPLYKIAADYHRKKFNQIKCVKNTFNSSKSGSYEKKELEKLINLESSDIKVKKIIDSHIILTFPHTAMDTCSETSDGNELWIYDKNSNSFMNKFTEPDGRSIGMDIVFLNNDKIPDLVVTDGGDYWTDKIYLSDENGEYKLDKTISCTNDNQSKSNKLCKRENLIKYYSQK